MISIVNKEKCCGCTACASTCPIHCISMKADEEGFRYPDVDMQNCTDCGLCERICPELNGYPKEMVKEVYAVRHKVKAVLDSSTSGGAFTAFAKETINQGGAVFGVAFDKDFRIVHMEIQGDDERLGAFRGSKYVQSNLGNSFEIVKKRLVAEQQVLFSGTSCQVAGLRSFLSKKYDNLLTVEVICHGTSSPLLWDKYLDYQKNKYKSTPLSVVFRKKTYGYHSGTMEIIFENGKRYTGSARVDYMLKSFFSEISSRPACYSCMCKGMERPADLSIYDCWHAGALISGLKDDDRGYTNVLVNTEKGRSALHKAEDNLECVLVDTQQAIKLDGIMVLNYPKRNKNRDQFYRKLNKGGLKQTVTEFIPVSFRDYIIECSKGFLYKIGLFSVFRKAVKM